MYRRRKQDSVIDWISNIYRYCLIWFDKKKEKEICFLNINKWYFHIPIYMYTCMGVETRRVASRRVGFKPVEILGSKLWPSLREFFVLILLSYNTYSRASSEDKPHIQKRVEKFFSRKYILKIIFQFVRFVSYFLCILYTPMAIFSQNHLKK